MRKGILRGLLSLPLGLGLCAGHVHATASDRTWTRSYNSQGLVDTVDGPRTDVSDVTRYTYDAHGLLSKVTDALGHATTYANYDSFGNPLQITDSNQVVTVLTYTPQEWPATVTRDSTGTPATTRFSYDAVGDITQTQDADGVVLRYTYDNARRLTEITDAAGNRIHYTLDVAGNRLRQETFSASNQLTHSVSQTFNSLSQLLTLADGLNRTVLSYNYPDGYDAAGHPTHSADASGTQRTQTYDGLNRLASSIDDASGADAATRNTSTTYVHDASDHLASVTDPSSLTTAYLYDGLGNRTALQSPDTGTSTDTFDTAGNALVHVDANGVVSTSRYDALNRRTSTTFADATLNIAYAYDEADTITGCTRSAPIGRLTRIVENAVTTVYCYDHRGNVTQKRQITGSITDTTSYAYTLGDRLSQLIEPDGTIINDSYNALGQLSGIQVIPVGASASAIVSAITYLPFGPMSGYTLGNGQTVTRTYDANYALTDITSPALNLHFARDAMGRIVAEGNTAGAKPANETYRYDAMSRLVEVDDANGKPIQSYSYNKTGDRLSKTGGLLPGTYTYTIGTHKLSGVDSTARTSDANGNTTASAILGNTYGYGYNGRNRMTIAQLNGNTVGTYTYNAAGQRIAKTATIPQATAERFVYDQAGHLIAEYGSTNRDYLWMGDTPVAVIDNTIKGSLSTAAINYITADALNTPRAVSSAAGTVIWQWAYLGNPFGENQPASAAGYVLNLRFAGQYFDAESNTVYNVHRSYEPATGRYLQSDPAGMAGRISTYAYTGNAPLDRVDPDGLRDIFVGGFGDAASGIVRSYYNNYHLSNPNSAYYSWIDLEDILRDIANAKPGDPINLIGHSYGGDTAAKAAIQSCKKIDLLITIDPVSRHPPDLNVLAGKVGKWVDVDAEANNVFQPSNFIAGIGGGWNKAPNGIAGSYIQDNGVNHEDFETMMNASGVGMNSPAEILGGAPLSNPPFLQR